MPHLSAQPHARPHGAGYAIHILFAKNKEQIAPIYRDFYRFKGLFEGTIRRTLPDHEQKQSAGSIVDSPPDAGLAAAGKFSLYVPIVIIFREFPHVAGAA